MTAAETARRHQRAGPSAEQAFERLAEPFRRELKLHCYRMLGSVHEAEDLVQETYLRAWRSFGSFDGRGSFRAWLYRIATNACLDALASRRSMRRAAPRPAGACRHRRTDARGRSADRGRVARALSGFEPGRDRRRSAESGGALCVARGRAACFCRRHSAAAAAPARRAPAVRRARLVGRRSRARCSADRSPRSTARCSGRARRSPNAIRMAGRRRAPQPNPAQQELLDRYARAWEGHDLDGFVALLKEDATFTMPPWRQWYAGRDAIGAFVALAWSSVGELRLVADGGQRATRLRRLCSHGSGTGVGRPRPSGPGPRQ